jgi:hypothetical protein
MEPTPLGNVSFPLPPPAMSLRQKTVKTVAMQEVVINALKRTLVIDRAYRAALGFAMNQIPLDT